MTFTVVYYETNRIERTVEAATVEEAIAASEALRVAEGGYWEGCNEESFGTDGVVEVLDATGKRAYDSGQVSIQALFDAVINRRTRLAHFHNRSTRPA
jgi:hypothetical protein